MLFYLLMLLLVGQTELPAGVNPIMEASPARPKVGQPVDLTFRVEQDGVPLVDYDVVHEQKLHLIVVSADYEDFQHVHPVLDATGTFTEKGLVLHRPGPYYVFFDATPEGSRQILHRFPLAVEGAGQPLELAVDLAPKVIDGVTVELETMPGVLKTGDAMLHFRLSRDGRPVTDLKPYLGAMGHVVALGDAGKPFLHVHPMEGGHEGHEGHAGMSMGHAQPGEVVFHANFPAPGLYKIWGQFQRGEQMLIAPFVVRVER